MNCYSGVLCIYYNDGSVIRGRYNAATLACFNKLLYSVCSHTESASL